MKLIHLVFPIVGALAFALPAGAGTDSAKSPKNPVAPAPDESPGITLGVNYDSRLIYHGIDFGEHFVTGDATVDVPLGDTLEASFEAGYGNVFEPDVTGGDYQRMTLGAGLTTYLGAAELGLGYRWIHHGDVPDTFADDGHEAGLTLASSIGPANIGFGCYRDFGDDGWYLEAAMNTEINVNERLSVVPGVALGYGLDYAANRTALNAVLGDGFFAVTPSIALPIRLAENATLTPYIAGRIALAAIDAADGTDYLYGGVSITVRF